MQVGEMREDYREGELNRADMAADPFHQFDLWFREAVGRVDIPEANAMTLATAGTDGRVTARTVLLKEWDADGFIFFTNYESSKARQIAENDQVALLFAWLPMARQIAISGRAEKISSAQSLAYFASRPFASRIGAWASQQSSVVNSRKLMEKKFEEMSLKFADGEVPLPDFWGGYRVRPETIEFWQGRTSRLHDRFLYTKATDGSWGMDRLSP